MTITPDMVDADLRGMFWPMKALAALMSRPWAVKLMSQAGSRRKGAAIAGLHCEERYIPSRSGGPDIRVRLYKPPDASGPLPGLLYLHGGGYITGMPEDAAAMVTAFIEAAPCVIVAPDYRKAFEAPYPAALNDCYDTLLWLHEQAVALGIVENGLIVGGHSAGGGLTAALTLKATDTGAVPIAFQMPIYPMIDDRQATPSAASNAPVWNAKSNALGWRAYLRDVAEVPAYAAPARAADLSRMPPTITFVGDLEPFRDETLAYVERLRAAGVPVAFELFAGAYHAFDVVVPDAAISQAAWAFLLGAYTDFIERYVWGSGP